MKRIIYVLLLSFATAATFTSCTEDDVTPTTELNGGTGVLDPK